MIRPFRCGRLWALSLVIVAGCARKGNDSHTTPVLRGFIGRTDDVIETRFFPTASIRLATPPEEHKGAIITTWLPGNVSIQPVVSKAHDGTMASGVRASIKENEWILSGYGDPRSEGGETAEAYLDEDEMSDLAKALIYFQQVRDRWQSEPPKERTVLQFRSRDAFEVALIHDGGDSYGVQIGPRLDAALSPDQLAALRTAIEEAIKQIHAR